MNFLFKTFNFLVGFTVSALVMQAGMDFIPQTAEADFNLEAVLLPASIESQWVKVCENASEVTIAELQDYRSEIPGTKCLSVETVGIGTFISNASMSDIPRVSALQEI